MFLIFSGTTEGKLIWHHLHNAGVAAKVFVATDYGRKVMPTEALEHVVIGRLDICGMERVFRQEMLHHEKIALIDATHPYAFEVTKNLRMACQNVGLPYFRLLRSSINLDGVMEFDSVASVADYLSHVEGNALLTTGSKDLEAFTHVSGYGERLFPRILPAIDSIKRCEELGYLSKNIICMQGPFSVEMNQAMIKQTKAKYIVTKDTGASGGFEEKITAAKIAGVQALVVKRPKDDGLSFQELKTLLEKDFGVKNIDAEPFFEDELTTQTISSRFPMFFDLRGKDVLVAGGGKVALRRVKTLLNFGCSIKVVCEKAEAELLELAEMGAVDLEIASISECNIEGNFFMVITATDNHELNADFASKCKGKGAFVNVATNPCLSDFFFPAIITGGGVTGGIISHGGSDHRLVAKRAKELREFLNVAE